MWSNVVLILNLCGLSGLSPVYAAVNEATTIDSNAVAPSDNASSNLDHLVISPAPNIPPKENSPFWNYNPTSALIYRVGKYTNEETSNSNWSFGIGYADFSPDFKSNEYNLDLEKDLHLLSYSRRKTHLLNVQQRWSYKGILSLQVDPDKGLANLVDFRRMGIGLGFGFEHQFSQSYAVSFDVDASVFRDDYLVRALTSLNYFW